MSFLSPSSCGLAGLAGQPFSTALQAVTGGGERSSVPTSLPMLGWGRGGLWTSAGLSSTQAPGEVLEEESGRVLKGSGLSRGLRSAWARAGFRESRWAGGARIWVHLASERMGLSVSSGRERREQISLCLICHKTLVFM